MNKLTKQLSLCLALTLVLFLGSVSDVSAGADFMVQVLWNFVVGFLGLFVSLAGLMLNWAVQDYVIGFGTQFLQKGIGAAVNTLWENVRDFFNLTFIFGLVYLGFKMILNSDDSNSKRWLISLIIAALLVNFSLFFTKLVVDISNIISYHIAQAFVVASTGEVGISQKFMSIVGFSSIFDGNGGWDNLTEDTPYSYVFGTAILFIVMTFVFASGAFMLIIRYVVLCLYMIFSPLMFLGSVFPQLESVSKKYWSGFLGRAFFAPIYLLLVYMSAKVVATFYSGISTSSSFADLFKTPAGKSISISVGSVLAPFVITCIFLIAAVVVANKMGADGASMAIRAGNNIRSRAQRMATRGGQRLAANTVGRGARAVTSGLGRGLNTGVRRLQSADNRTLRAIGRNAVFRGTVGAAATGMTNSRFGLSTTRGQDVAAQTQRDQVGDRAQRLRHQRQAFADNNKKLPDAQKKFDAVKNLGDKNNEYIAAKKELDEIKEKIDTARNAAGSEVRDMSNEELQGLTLEELESSEIAVHLSDAQISALESSGRFTDDQIHGRIDHATGKRIPGGLKAARDNATFSQTEGVLDGTAASAEELGEALEKLGKTVSTLSDERITGMSASRLSESRVAMNLTDKHIEAIEKSGKYSATDIAAIKNARKVGHTAIASGDYGSAGLIKHAKDTSGNNRINEAVAEKQRQNMMSAGTKVIGKYSADMFKQSKIIKHLKPAYLEERIKNGLSEDDRKKIEDAINEELVKPGNESKQKMWEKWAKDSTWAGDFNFNFSSAPTPTPVIVDTRGNPLR